ncbi:MAG: zinc ribbon domain-containing protein [Chloroflexota bacterium]|nr:MAG: zinc ribbon domain-containing protein [Chloroflexota bacterium]
MSTTNCPNCGAERITGAAFCDTCGAAFQASTPAKSQEIICPNCGAHAAPGQAFCEQCGTALSQIQVQSAAHPAGISCPNCGQQAVPGGTFCDNCGARLQVADAAPTGATMDISSEPALEEPPQAKATPVMPRLVVQPSNTTLQFPANKNQFIVGREDPISSHFPDIELGAYGGDEGGVSRQHVRITRQGEQFLIEDLESVNYTFVNKQKLEPGSPRLLQDGDEVRFGRVVTIFRM